MNGHCIVMIRNNDELLAKASNDAGLAMAWLLATLGSKTSYKKLVRKDIINISIPETCGYIEKDSISLRLSSSLLYGVSLMYKQKVEYFFNDVSLTKTRLQKEVFLNTLVRKQNFKVINIDDKAKGKENRQIFLQEDPLFDIEMDLVRPYDREGEDENKKRIKQLDDQLYPDIRNPLSHTGLVADNEIKDHHSKTFDYFMEQGLHTLRELDEDSSHHEAVDFEFGNQGEIVNLNGENKVQGNNINESDLNMIDFDQIIESGGDDEDQNMISGVKDKTIMNDRTFQLSNDTYANQTALVTGKESNKKRNIRRVIVDTEAKFSSSDLKRHRDAYTCNMLLQNKRLKTNKTGRNNVAAGVKEIFKELNSLPFISRYSYKFLLEPNMTNNISLRLNQRRQNNAPEAAAIYDELELGRNIEHVPENEDLEKIHFELEQPLLDDLPQSQDIFDLSFPEIELSEIHSRSRSGSKRSSSSRYSAFPPTSDSYDEDKEYQEASMDDVPGTPYLLIDKNNSQNKFNSVLTKFFNFLQSRSILLGEQVRYDHRLNQHHLEYLDKEVTGQEEIVYSQVKLSVLIPPRKDFLVNGNDTEEAPVNRRLASSSFSCILQLASRDMITIKCHNHKPTDLLRCDQISILSEI